ncbi:hypothetical protein RFM26_08475 [Mesorhizobium sp. VK23B]|uniref:Uncharacterized protein n=1 Tax=Mesorhizobium dulcispinae TaxID=3072316 RepID=A0ABU4X9K2_9HYPH|nr:MULTISPECIES: hypothetical protein [unclassified Mesorhizobium]MDX8465716.1 hypothetical protein [Mesorhizobium sp. VK23B]MDX8471482.1 hypothetical protein [Mesorhizobium sp. VK23A]
MPFNEDFLWDHGRRPFDEVVKATLKRNGILRELVSYIEGGPRLPEDIVWLDGQIRPRQRTWNTDLVGFIDDDTLLHVEQQTNSAENMDIRMMEYGCLLATNFDLQYNVYPIYYYTGDSPISGRDSFAKITNNRWSIYNSYYYIDAGAYDAWTMFDSSRFEAASLGLLAREIPNETRLLRELVERAQSEFKDGSLITALVDCMSIASLRKRANAFRDAIPMILQEEMDRDPYFKALFDDARITEVKKFLQRAIDKARFVIPDQALRHLHDLRNLDQIAEIALELPGADSWEQIAPLCEAFQEDLAPRHPARG